MDDEAARARFKAELMFAADLSRASSIRPAYDIRRYLYLKEFRPAVSVEELIRYHDTVVAPRLEMANRKSSQRIKRRVIRDLMARVERGRQQGRKLAPVQEQVLELEQSLERGHDQRQEQDQNQEHHASFLTGNDREQPGKGRDSLRLVASGGFSRESSRSGIQALQRPPGTSDARQKHGTTVTTTTMTTLNSAATAPATTGRKRKHAAGAASLPRQERTAEGGRSRFPFPVTKVVLRTLRPPTVTQDQPTAITTHPPPKPLTTAGDMVDTPPELAKAPGTAPTARNQYMDHPSPSGFSDSARPNGPGTAELKKPIVNKATGRHTSHPTVQIPQSMSSGPTADTAALDDALTSPPPPPPPRGAFTTDILTPTPHKTHAMLKPRPWVGARTDNEVRIGITSTSGQGKARDPVSNQVSNETVIAPIGATTHSSPGLHKDTGRKGLNPPARRLISTHEETRHLAVPAPDQEPATERSEGTRRTEVSHGDYKCIVPSHLKHGTRCAPPHSQPPHDRYSSHPPTATARVINTAPAAIATEPKRRRTADVASSPSGRASHPPPPAQERVQKVYEAGAPSTTTATYPPPKPPTGTLDIAVPSP